MNKGRTQRVSWNLDTVHTLTNPTVTLCVCVCVSIRTMKASEVKRKTMTSLAYGPCPITSLIPWKKDMGSDLGRQDSGKRTSTKEWTKMQKNGIHLKTFSTIVFSLFRMRSSLSGSSFTGFLLVSSLVTSLCALTQPVRPQSQCRTIACSYNCAFSLD